MLLCAVWFMHCARTIIDRYCVSHLKQGGEGATRGVEGKDEERGERLVAIYRSTRQTEIPSFSLSLSFFMFESNQELVNEV